MGCCYCYRLECDAQKFFDKQRNHLNVSRDASSGVITQPGVRRLRCNIFLFGSHNGINNSFFYNISTKIPHGNIGYVADETRQATYA